MSIFRELVRQGIKRGASDIHLLNDQVPVFRIDGRLEPALEYQKMSASEIKKQALMLIDDRICHQLEREGQADFALSLIDLGRVRINLYSQSGSWAMAVRILPIHLPDFTSLELPDTILQLLQSKGGLLLVAGPTGSGKTTTLAAMIDFLNQNCRLNIVTLEDPIEYQHLNGTCLVNQREIGRDTESFTLGLKAALRQDPDLIMLGELRDPETIFTAINAAQTGHLVLASLHSGSSTQAIERIIHGFPADRQNLIRIQLATTLLSVITQQLIPATGGKGRVAAREILIVNTAVRNLIRDNRIYQIPSVIQTGSAYGMRSMDKAIQMLYEENKTSLPDLSLSLGVKRSKWEGKKTICESNIVHGMLLDI